MNEWKAKAREIIRDYAACRTTAEQVEYIEYLGDRGTDLAVLEEILRFAVLGAVNKGTGGE